MRFFKGFKNLIMNISQIIIVGLLFPAFSIVCYIFSADNPGSSFWSNIFSMLSEIPAFKLICGLVAQLLDGFTAGNLTEITLTVLLKAFPETLLVAICVHFFVQLFTREWDAMDALLMKARKTDKRQLFVIPILPTFLGIFVSMIVVNLIELFKNQAAVIISEFAVIIIMLIGIRMLFGRVFFSKAFSLMNILTFVADAVYAVIVLCYVSTLFLVSAGFSTDMGSAVGLVAKIVFFTAIASVAEAFVHGLGGKK